MPHGYLETFDPLHFPKHYISKDGLRKLLAHGPPALFSTCWCPPLFSSNQIIFYESMSSTFFLFVLSKYAPQNWAMRSQAHYFVKIHVRPLALLLVTNESRIFFFIYNLDNYLKMSQFPWPNIISFIFSLSCMHDYFTLKIPHSNNVWSLFLSNLVTARIGWYESLNQEIVWFNLFSGLVRFLRC